MTQVFTIEPNPHWVIIDNFSKLPNGAAIYTYRSLNPSEFKPAFQDAAGSVPYGQPIVGFGNGTMPPIFWEFDDAAPEELYYIRVYDSADPATQNFLWDFDGLSGGTGGGGGTIVTNNDIENLIINGQFLRNAGNQVGAPSIGTNITIAPSNNAGFVGVPNDVANDPPVAPDIIFAKLNQSDSDNLSFVDVTPIGTNNLGLNPTPQFYVQYNCTVAPSAQTYKCIQFPVVKGLQNLSGATVAIQFFANLVSGNANGVTLNLRQFFGNGGSPSADVNTPIGGGPLALLPGWNTYKLTQVIPSIASKTLGTCGNDALYFQIQFILSDVINVQFILPSMYLGTVPSNFDFHTLDQIDAIVNSPRTGDIRTSINSVILGWIRMNDGTIGDATSGATSRANIDTFPLYDLIWNNVSNTFAPVTGGRGASSIADFTAHKPMALTRSLGRIMAGALPAAASQAFTRNVNDLDVTSSAGFYNGMAVTTNVSGGLITAGVIYYAIIVSSTKIALATTTANALAGTKIVIGAALVGTLTSVNVETLGSFLGEEVHVQTIAEMPSHNHPGSTTPNGAAAGGGNSVVQSNTNTSSSTLNIAAQGGGIGFNIIQPTVYMNVFIKL